MGGLRRGNSAAPATKIAGSESFHGHSIAGAPVSLPVCFPLSGCSRPPPPLLPLFHRDSRPEVVLKD